MDRNDGIPAKGADRPLGRKVERLSDAHCRIEESRPAGDDIGFICTLFVQHTLPHREAGKSVFERKNGDSTATFMTPPSIGLPFGNLPRLLLIHLTTEAVRSRSREIALGPSLSRFIKSLFGRVSGGEKGSITRFKKQLLRTLSLTTTLTEVKEDRAELKNAPLADEFEVHWAAVYTDRKSGLPAKVRLGERMFDYMLEHAVPVDMRAVRALQQSPLALDVYCWAAYRAPSVPSTHATRIQWSSLKKQFGSDYDAESDFKIAFCLALKQVQLVYPKLMCEVSASHFVLRRSDPSVPRRTSRRLHRQACG